MTYEPGTVAVATVRGVPNVRVAYADPSDVGMSWFVLPDHVDGVGDWVATENVTDIRPLVVLDLDERLSAGGFDWPAIVRVLRADGASGRYTRDAIADQIEAQAKPPRIPEPGLWGVVEAGVKQHDVRLRWVRLGDNYRPDDSDEYDRPWSDLVDPVLIRDGIEESS